MLAIEVQTTLAVRGVELFEEHPSEVSRQHAHGQEEATFTGYPLLPIRGQSAAGDDAMQMRVMGQGRAQVWSTAMKPRRAPKRLGSAAMVSKVAAVALNNRS